MSVISYKNLFYSDQEMIVVRAGGKDEQDQEISDCEIWIESLAPDNWIRDDNTIRLPRNLENAVGLTEPNGYEFYLVGGGNPDYWQSLNEKIYRFHCESYQCFWTTMELSLDEGHRGTTAFFVEDKYFNCF